MKGIESLELMEKVYSNRSPFDYSFLLAEIIQNYRGKKFNRLLDVGAGLGFLGDLCNIYNIDYYGLEGNEETVVKIKENKKLKVEKFIFDISSNLPFSDNSGIVCNQTLEHVEKEVGMHLIKEMIRCTENGGVIIIKSPSYYCRFQRTAPHHVYCWKPKELFNYVKSLPYNLEIKRSFQYLEFWHLLKYNEKIEKEWHLEVKYPKLKHYLHIPFIILGKVFRKFLKSEILVSNSDLTIIKKG